MEEIRGSFEGAIRIPLRSSSFLFNDLGFLAIPRKSLKFLMLLFSIPIARSINPDDSVALTRLSSLNWTKNRLVLGSWTVLDSIGRSIQSPYFAGLTEHTLAAPAFRLFESLLFTAHECR
jgi:hypothetical protein